MGRAQFLMLVATVAGSLAIAPATFAAPPNAAAVAALVTSIKASVGASKGADAQSLAKAINAALKGSDPQLAQAALAELSSSTSNSPAFAQALAAESRVVNAEVKILAVISANPNASAATLQAAIDQAGGGVPTDVLAVALNNLASQDSGLSTTAQSAISAANTDAQTALSTALSTGAINTKTDPLAAVISGGSSGGGGGSGYGPK